MTLPTHLPQPVRIGKTRNRTDFSSYSSVQSETSFFSVLTPLFTLNWFTGQPVQTHYSSSTSGDEAESSGFPSSYFPSQTSGDSMPTSESDSSDSRVAPSIPYDLAFVKGASHSTGQIATTISHTPASRNSPSQMQEFPVSRGHINRGISLNNTEDDSVVRAPRASVEMKSSKNQKLKALTKPEKLLPIWECPNNSGLSKNQKLNVLVAPEKLPPIWELPNGSSPRDAATSSHPPSTGLKTNDVSEMPQNQPCDDHGLPENSIVDGDSDRSGKRSLFSFFGRKSGLRQQKQPNALLSGENDGSRGSPRCSTKTSDGLRFCECEGIHHHSERQEVRFYSETKNIPNVLPMPRSKIQDISDSQPLVAMGEESIFFEQASSVLQKARIFPEAPTNIPNMLPMPMRNIQGVAESQPLSAAETGRFFAADSDCDSRRYRVAAKQENQADSMAPVFRKFFQSIPGSKMTGKTFFITNDDERLIESSASTTTTQAPPQSILRSNEKNPVEVENISKDENTPSTLLNTMDEDESSSFIYETLEGIDRWQIIGVTPFPETASTDKVSSDPDDERNMERIRGIFKVIHRDSAGDNLRKVVAKIKAEKLNNIIRSTTREEKVASEDEAKVGRGRENMRKMLTKIKTENLNLTEFTRVNDKAKSEGEVTVEPNRDYVISNLACTENDGSDLKMMISKVQAEKVNKTTGNKASQKNVSLKDQGNIELLKGCSIMNFAAKDYNENDLRKMITKFKAEKIQKTACNEVSEEKVASEDEGGSLERNMDPRIFNFTRKENCGNDLRSMVTKIKTEKLSNPSWNVEKEKRMLRAMNKVVKIRLQEIRRLERENQSIEEISPADPKADESCGNWLFCSCY